MPGLRCQLSPDDQIVRGEDAQGSRVDGEHPPRAGAITYSVFRLLPDGASACDGYAVARFQHDRFSALDALERFKKYRSLKISIF
jgi:hypothetical protein